MSSTGWISVELGILLPSCDRLNFAQRPFHDYGDRLSKHDIYHARHLQCDSLCHAFVGSVPRTRILPTYMYYKPVASNPLANSLRASSRTIRTFCLYFHIIGSFRSITCNSLPHFFWPLWLVLRRRKYPLASRRKSTTGWKSYSTLPWSTHQANS